MADRDSISHRRNKLIEHAFKEFYYPDELHELLRKPEDGKDRINLVHVSDAIIGIVYDNTPDEAEFLVDFLSGNPVDKLRHEYYGLAPEYGSKEWSVLSAAARVAIDALRKADIATVSERQKYKLDAERPLVEEDLRNTIISFYEKGVVSSELAQGMLLLFGQSVSNASQSGQRTARTDTRNALKKEMAHIEEFTKQNMSVHATKALYVLNLMLKAVITANNRVSHRSIAEVEAIFERENPQFTREQINERVAEYIAYGLMLIYPEQN